MCTGCRTKICSFAIPSKLVKNISCVHKGKRILFFFSIFSTHDVRDNGFIIINKCFGKKF